MLLQDSESRSGIERRVISGDRKGVGSLFSFRADACGESDVIVSIAKIPGTCSELMPLLVQEPMGMVRGASYVR